MRPLQIIVISLKHSEGRRVKVAGEMAKTKLQWRFIDAVDGSKLDLSTVPYNASRVKRMQGYTLTPREIGCYLSHMKCWQECVDQNLVTLIFEDDFVLLPHFESVLNTLTEDYRNWDIVRLQALEDKAFKCIADFGTYQLIQNDGDPLGATAYLVNPISAKALIEESRDIYEPLDHYIEHHEKHGLKMLAIKPYPVTVADITRATSTITDRPDRKPVSGIKKWSRSFFRLYDRKFSRYPWFPK